MHDVNAAVAPKHRIIVEEYERIVAERDLEQVELIDGVIYEVSPESARHVDAAFMLQEIFLERFPGTRVRCAGSVGLSDVTLLQPDVYVAKPLRSPDVRYPDAADVVLAVEVALSTWSRDMGLKRSAYARAGIAEYWVVVPEKGGRIVRRTEPVGDTYRTAETVPLPDGLDSLADVAGSLLR